MRTLFTTTCSLFLLLVISCNEPRAGGGAGTIEVGSLVEKVVQPNKNTTQKEKTSSTTFWDFCAEKDVFIAILYALTLTFSYIYYKQTGKHNTLLENNFSQLSRRLAWRQRIAVFLLGLLHNKTSNNRRRK